MGGRNALIFIFLALGVLCAARAENASAAQALVRGAVIDEFENLVPVADLKLECGSSPPLLGKTDRFGTFSFEQIPAGPCKVYAAYRDMAGVQGVNVSSPGTNEVVVVLHRTPAAADGVRPIGMVLLGALGVLAVGLALSSPWKKTHQGRPAPSLELEEKRAPDTLASDATMLSSIVNGAQRSRFVDIFQTLGEKEQRVVAYLKEQGCFVSQNKIARAVGVPKTSLRRIVESLERKNLIETERAGKFRKIRLTAWFLEGEE
jgi:biotin operon repressor